MAIESAAPHTDTRYDELIGHLLHRANQQVNRLFSMGSKGSDPTWRQYIVLLAIVHADRPNQTDIVRATGIDRSTLADMVFRMVQKGLIKRVRTQRDARANLLSLTGKGSRLLNALEGRANEAENALRKMVPASSLRSFIRALTSIAMTSIEDETPAAGRRGKASSAKGKGKAKTKTKTRTSTVSAKAKTKRSASAAKPASAARRAAGSKRASAAKPKAASARRGGRAIRGRSSSVHASGAPA